MKLLTQKIIKALPERYSQETNPDPMVVCKFFNPTGHGTWYVLEGYQEDGEWIFFGLVDLHVKELGYFCLSELEAYKGTAGLGIERDKWFEPQPLSKFK